ncbi:MAG: hypothetical protein GXO89_07500 [Chlorobi bacterium]|nr:hypothetical protein [Chlorobiota bacterium]
MKFFKYPLVFLFFSVLISACETDFDTTAPYKDITVVYGLLDQKDQNHYIKINKAFLGEGNALIYAQEADSSNYGYPMEVVMEEYNENGQLVNTLEFDTTTIYNKETGVFYAPEQVVYHAKLDLAYEIKVILNISGDTVSIDTFWLNYKNTFKLKIKNPVSGKEIFSETKLVHDFDIKKPGFGQTIKFVTDPINPTEFTWEKAENGGMNELKVTFHYSEIHQNSNDTVDKSIELISSTVSSPASSSTISYYYWGNDFFTSCLNKIPYSDPVEEANVVARFSGPVVTTVSVAETEFSLYMEVYEPSTSIVQEKPEYTNIENGIGLFSARYRKSKPKKLHAETIADLQKIDDNILKFEY